MAPSRIPFHSIDTTHSYYSSFHPNSLFLIFFPHTYAHSTLSLFISFPLYSSTTHYAQHTTILPSLLNLSYPPKKTQQKTTVHSASIISPSATQQQHRQLTGTDHGRGKFPLFLSTPHRTQPSIVIIHAHPISNTTTKILLLQKNTMLL